MPRTDLDGSIRAPDCHDPLAPVICVKSEQHSIAAARSSVAIVTASRLDCSDVSEHASEVSELEQLQHSDDDEPHNVQDIQPQLISGDSKADSRTESDVPRTTKFLTSFDRDLPMLLSRVTKRLKSVIKLERQQLTQDLLRELGVALRCNRSSEVWTLSRRLARNSRGPRNRVHYRPHTKQPLSDEWLQYLQAPGSQGGCEAKEIDFEHEINNMREDNENAELIDTTNELLVAAKSDFDRVSTYFRHAAKRKWQPEWSVPLEVYWMLFQPNYKVKRGTPGLGAPRSRVSTYTFR